VTPARRTDDEFVRRALLEQGVAVAVNLRHHGKLIAWAKERGLFVRVDRDTLEIIELAMASGRCHCASGSTLQVARDSPVSRERTLSWRLSCQDSAGGSWLPQVMHLVQG
jgi:hypothetical protein